MSKHEAHQKYFNAAGRQVPGVTTIVGQLNKPQLAPAANKLGLANIDSTAYWKSLADIGSLAHSMILSHVKGETCDTDDYTKKEIDLATNCFNSYLSWEMKHKVVEPILAECSLVSEQHQYGGTLDCYCTLDGTLTLIDFKTGGIFPEAVIQLAGYQQLLAEHGHFVKQAIILGIPRQANDSFIERTYTSFETGWEAFWHLLHLYPIMKVINKDKGE